MKAKVSHRKRYNLYYIFAQDQKAHPMPEGRTERVRQKLLQIFAAKQKPPSDEQRTDRRSVVPPLITALSRARPLGHFFKKRVMPLRCNGRPRHRLLDAGRGGRLA